MRPTINNNVLDSTAKGDAIYINQYSSFTTNDIVVAKVDWHNDYVIKRIVGTPGDKIEIKEENGHYAVYVNDSLLYTKEKYMDKDSFGLSGSVKYFEDYKSFLINPEFQKWVKHENGHSYIELGEEDYFIMGDNWGHTTDSISHGPVKTSAIIGKVDLIVDATNTSPFTATLFFLKKLFSIN